MTRLEARTLKRGDVVSIRLLQGKHGLIVKVNPKHLKMGWQIYVEGVGLVMDARPDDLTLVRREEEDPAYDKPK